MITDTTLFKIKTLLGEIDELEQMVSDLKLLLTDCVSILYDSSKTTEPPSGIVATIYDKNEADPRIHPNESRFAVKLSVTIKRDDVIAWVTETLLPKYETKISELKKQLKSICNHI